jgi:hypothetical protein
MKNRLKEERVNSNENQNYASDNDESDELVEECYQSVLIDANDPMLRSKMIIDYGATSHMIPNYEEFVNFRNEISYIKLGNNSRIVSKGRGDTAYLKNVMYAPSLISISKLSEDGYEALFVHTEKCCYFWKKR